jgi:ABC-type glycerol-3-phosphate transport system substrate-binding protein
MQMKAAVLATALMLAASGAQAADLVVWWEKGFYPEEDEAVAEVIAAFEEDTGEQVELVHHSQAELPEAIAAAIDAGKPPDVAFGLWLADYIPQWATIAWQTFRTPSAAFPIFSIRRRSNA